MTLTKRETTTKEAHVDPSRGVVCWGSQGGVDAQPYNERYPKNANLPEQPSASKFPVRHPILHGLFLELCSFRHRIQLLWQQGGTRSLEIGPVYQQTNSQSYPVLNKQTHLRIQGIQRLLAECPWLSGEDCRLFLLGWNRALESGAILDDTAQSNVDMQVPLCPSRQEQARQFYAVSND
jgi:hypothetical protein